MNYIKELEIKFKRVEIGYNILTKKINSSKAVYNLFKSLQDETSEKFIGVYLDSENKINCFEVLHIGGINCSMVSIQKIIRGAIMTNATRIIIIHNHPSGSIIPSPEDDEITEKIKQSCSLMGLKLLDHIIVGDGFYSYNDNGKINHFYNVG